MIKPIVEFHVAGAAVGKGRPKFARRGVFVTAYTPEKTKTYEAQVKDAAKKAMGSKAPCGCAVQVNLSIFVTPPASWSKKKRAAALSREFHPTTKPDMDNVIKGIFDACNGIVFDDDKQICSLQVTKRYREVAGVDFRAYELLP